MFSIGIFLLVYARFNGVNGVILPFLQLSVDPQLYKLDFYITHAIVAGSSPVFDLLDAFRLDATNPVFIIASYVVLTAVSGLGIWLILRDVYGVEARLTRLAILFGAIFADAKFINYGKSSWVFEHNFSLSFVAAALRVWALYCALTGRFVLMCALLVPLNLFSFKVGWVFTIFAGLLLLQARSRSLAAWGLLALSMVSPAWSALATHVSIAPAEARSVLEVLLMQHGAEDNPFQADRVGVALFLAGYVFMLTPFARIGEPFDGRIRLMMHASMAVLVAGGLYLTFGYQLRAFPVVALISPARALEVASLLIYLTLLVWVARAASLAPMEKVGFFLALIILKVPRGDHKWVALAGAIALAALVLHLGRRWLAGRVPVVAGLKSPIGFELGLALLAPLLGAFFALNLSGQRASYRHDAALGFYDASLPADTVGMLKAIAAQPQDRRLLFVRPEGRTWSAPDWNPYVRKSSIKGDPYYMRRLEEMTVLLGYGETVDQLLAGLAAGQVPDDVRGALTQLQVHVVLPQAYGPSLSGWQPVETYGPWVEFAP